MLYRNSCDVKNKLSHRLFYQLYFYHLHKMLACIYLSCFIPFEYECNRKYMLNFVNLHSKKERLNALFVIIFDRSLGRSWNPYFFHRSSDKSLVFSYLLFVVADLMQPLMMDRFLFHPYLSSFLSPFAFPTWHWSYPMLHHFLAFSHSTFHL